MILDYSLEDEMNVRLANYSFIENAFSVLAENTSFSILPRSPSLIIQPPLF
jgi:hypothetical protein